MAQTLSQIKSLLASRGLRPKRRLGQNFLHDGNQMSRIVQTAAIEPGDAVLEVGAGTGALTERLLEAGALVVAVEVDRQLEPILRDRLTRWGSQVTLIMGDVLAAKHVINAQVMAAIGQRPFKLVANLPYQVASPLLANLSLDAAAMTGAVVMVQREVADRLTASPGTKAYGPLGIVVQAMCDVQRLFTLTPACFWPQPQVDSAVVRLARRVRPMTDDPHAFAAFVQRLFQQRRKQLGAILGRAAVLPDGLSPILRPEALTVAQLVALAKLAI